MTARQKRSVYRVVEYVLLAAALALTIFLIIKGDIGAGSRVLVCALVCVAAAVLQAHYLIHELGHLVFGLLAGFRPVSFAVACVRFPASGKKSLLYRMPLMRAHAKCTPWGKSTSKDGSFFIRWAGSFSISSLR